MLTHARCTSSPDRAKGSSNSQRHTPASIALETAVIDWLNQLPK